MGLALNSITLACIRSGMLFLHTRATTAILTSLSSASIPARNVAKAQIRETHTLMCDKYNAVEYLRSLSEKLK